MGAIVMVTDSIKQKYCKDLISWGLIKFGGTINTKKSVFKEVVDTNQKHPIRISDINMIRGFN
jgi:hypothetical protein